MRLIVPALASLLFVTSAYADCGAVPDRQVEVTLEKVTAPIYNAKGQRFTGCVLHAKGRVLGYAREYRLCETPVGRKMKVRLSYRCCDTGPDHGDFECVIRSKSILGVGSVHGNGVAVYSVAPEPRS